MNFCVKPKSRCSGISSEEKGLARESPQGCGMTSMPVLSSVKAPNALHRARTEREVLTIQKLSPCSHPPHLSPSPSNPSKCRVCQLIHSHKLIPNEALSR